MNTDSILKSIQKLTSLLFFLKFSVATINYKYVAWNLEYIIFYSVHIPYVYCLLILFI